MPDRTLTLTLRNELAAIAEAAELIEAHGRFRDWPAHWVMNANLSIDELVTNAVSYAYADNQQDEILITLTEDQDALVVVLEHRGSAFDPFTDAPEADLESGLNERDVKGLGVHFVKSFTDEAFYERRHGRNRITLVLHRQQSPPRPSPGRSAPADPLPEEIEELDALVGMNARDARVAALDPLALDDVFRSLLADRVPDLAEAERRFRQAAAHVPLRRWSRDEALAALRDLGMSAAIFEQRHGIRPCDDETVGEALDSLGETAREVPRETVYSQGPRNPTGSRMRTFTALAEERIFYLSIAKAARCLPECILNLHKATSAAESSAAEHLMQATMALESLVSALVRVKRTMPPATFSSEIAQFSAEREVAGQRYRGPTAGQMGVPIVDRMLFGAEMTGCSDYDTYYMETIRYLPWELRGIARRQRARPSLLDLARDGRLSDHAALVCLRELFQVLYKFRVPHLRLAEASFSTRPKGAKGSGGYDPAFLRMLADFTRHSIDEVDALIGVR